MNPQEDHIEVHQAEQTKGPQETNLDPQGSVNKPLLIEDCWGQFYFDFIYSQVDPYEIPEELIYEEMVMDLID